MRRLIVVAVATLLTVMVLNPAPAEAARTRVTADFFGMHDYDLAAPLPYGSVRLWDVGTTWADLEPAPGHYEFARLDALVAKANARHAKVLLTLGSTPAWAAVNPTSKSSAWLQPGTSSPPKSEADWIDYVHAVAARYRGRIDSYQIWNEASLPQFWASTPAVLARLTAIAFAVIRQADPAAEVVSTPMLPRQPTWETWSTAYLKELRRYSWPVDVFAIHSYQRDKHSSPDGRVAAIQRMQRVLTAAHAPARPMWDTEGNYTSNSYAHYKITGRTAADWVARAYLDSLRLHVGRTYWYAYNRPVGHLGITIAPNSSAARSYASVRSWLVGAAFTGCTTTRAKPGAAVTVCAFRRQHKDFRVMWASANKKHTTYTGKGKTICRLLTGCSRRASTKTKVTTSPVLVR